MTEQYYNYCNACEHDWLSDMDDECCPECGEMENIYTDYAEEGEWIEE